MAKDLVPGRWLRRPAWAAAVAALTLLAAACSGAGHSTSQVRPAAATAKPSATAAAAAVTITPANGATDAGPSAGITVTAAGGTLTNVTVHTAGEAVSGRLSQDGTGLAQPVGA